jgi:hypothetical protein
LRLLRLGPVFLDLATLAKNFQCGSSRKCERLRLILFMKPSKSARSKNGRYDVTNLRPVSNYPSAITVSGLYDDEVETPRRNEEMRALASASYGRKRHLGADFAVWEE